MYDKTFSLVTFTVVLLQITVYILPFWKVNDKKDLIKNGFEAFEGEASFEIKHKKVKVCGFDATSLKSIVYYGAKSIVVLPLDFI